LGGCIADGSSDLAPGSRLLLVSQGFCRFLLHTPFFTFLRCKKYVAQCIKKDLRYHYIVLSDVIIWRVVMFDLVEIERVILNNQKEVKELKMEYLLFKAIMQSFKYDLIIKKES
jgi:hypothetical protein